VAERVAFPLGDEDVARVTPCAPERRNVSSALGRRLDTAVQWCPNEPGLRAVPLAADGPRSAAPAYSAASSRST
jgi:hypothetical protein